MSLVRFEGVRREFGDVTALEHLDLEVRTGEVFGLLGSNGAGKTTALRILCGILAPSAGRVLLAGVDVQSDPLAARRRFSFVPDGAPMYANLSPRQHLALVGRLHGVDEERIATESSRLLDALELGTRGDDPVGQFSRGMRQKTALACAILPRPELLILDEPSLGLAPKVVQGLFERLATIKAGAGTTMLIVEQNANLALAIGDRAYVLEAGEVVRSGTAGELRHDDGIRRAYLGT